MNKNVMRVALALLLAAVLSACDSSSSQPPTSNAEIIRQVNHALSQITLGITSENIDDAADYVHQQFLMHQDVAARFNVGPFNGRGRQAFRAFFERVRDQHGELTLQVQVQNIEINTDVATAFVRVTFSALRVDPAPPQEVAFSENDVLVFEYDRGHYRLRTWGHDEHQQGGGGGI